MAIDMELMSKLIARLNAERSHLSLRGAQAGVYTHMPALRDLLEDTMVAFLRARDAEGRSLAQRWEAAGFAGLNNDEQVLLGHRAASRVRFLQLGRVLDRKSLEATDLLAPGAAPMVVVDYGLVTKAQEEGWESQFIVAVTIPMPEYLRLIGGYLLVPGSDPAAALQNLGKVITGMGGPADRAGWPDWWLDHARKARKAVEDLSASAA